MVIDEQTTDSHPSNSDDYCGKATYKVKIPCSELRRFYEDERMSMIAIAEHYGCSPTTIANRVREYEIPTRPGLFQAIVIDANELRRLYTEEEWLVKDILRHMNISESTFNYYRRKFNIPPRPRRRRKRRNS